MDFDLSNLIFVGGAPRSGTTLVQRILNAHPDIYGGPELDLVPSISQLYGKFESRIESKKIDIWLDQSHCRKIFRDFIVNLFHQKMASERVRFISEKTPANILAFPRLVELCPEARFIWVIRDPRAVVCSMRQVARKSIKNKHIPAKFTRSILDSCNYIERCTTCGEETKMNTDNIITIGYLEKCHSAGLERTI